MRGAELGLPLCEELARLAPFGLGNPGVTLLVDDCELDRLDTVGEGKHLRFRVRQRGRDAGSAIAFGFGSQIDRYRRLGHYDVAFRLQENRWNGTVAPQLVVRRIFDTDERYDELRTWFAGEWGRGEQAWTPEVRAVFDELGLSPAGRRATAEPARVGGVPAPARRAAARARLPEYGSARKREQEPCGDAESAGFSASTKHGSTRIPREAAHSCLGSPGRTGEGSCDRPG